MPCFVSENVDTNVDLGLNLVKFLDINNKEKWVNELTNSKFEKLEDKEVIRERIEEKGYNSMTNVKKIQDIYFKSI